eukprot:TRINITY_DN29527_c0_g1_i1.p1 TRINITY_DN29527_c0_g1~~TRINITY_DN29527_c0_g1_i1.p1  ORF type:complete len:689 (+),score=126.76 TRINITY_DN29527_c0_g1_i1:53-2068(+)
MVVGEPLQERMEQPESGYDAAQAQESAPRRRGGEALVIGGGESLQSRFLTFKKERQRERQLAKRCVRTSVGGVRDPEGLRKRFVEVCRSYIGVPYAKCKHEPDDPDYNAPLFLDCCGLLRRAVADLKEEFGFSLGRWNQAYQWETLPVDVPPEQMKPGDIIFIEGEYFDKSKKAQRNNIVHVEVFSGGETGEEVIGSRWARSNAAEGKVRGVQIHPSWKFVSKNYEIKKYYFRSLDTWLNGICRSQSYPDVVNTATVSMGGRSVFQDDAEGASDDEEDKSAFMPDPYQERPTFYVGDGNNWKVVAGALEARGWARLPFEAHFTTRFDLKWVEQRSKIDYRRHLEGQLVNHLPNNDIITAKVQLLHTIRAHEAKGAERFDFLPSTYLSERGGDKLAALAEAEENPEAAWILKPSRTSGGKGIEFVKGPQALREFLFPPPRDMAEEPARGPRPVEGWVIQSYVDKPLLLKGRKFDLRAYCLVARTDPHLWLFHPGYCKVSLEAYSADFSNRFAHLTNACVQKQHPDYRASYRGAHIWSEADAEKELIETGRWSADRGPFWKGIHEQMKRCIAWLFEASREQLQRRNGYFDLLGLDFMVDEDFKLYLLEVNSNPAIWFDSSAILQELVPRLIGHSLDVVLAANKPGMDRENLGDVPAAFSVVVDENSDFVYRGV